MKRWSVVLLVCCIMAGCATNQAAAPSAWPRPPSDGRAELICIFALDKNNVWVGGSCHDPAVTLHSIMYHTTDGGRSWHRASPAIDNCSIFTIFFLDAKTGWAAGAWTTESAGKPFVLGTKDGGITWTKTEVPVERRPTPLFVPVSIAFVTPKIGLLHLSGCIAEDEQSVLVTRNGGQSWEFSHGMKDENGPRSTLSVTKDGVLWKLDDKDDILMSGDDGLTWQQTETHPVKASNIEH